MKAKKILWLSAISFLMATDTASIAGTITFAGYTWIVRSSGQSGPGPNYWDQDNVSVDTNGYLHLRVTQQNDRWHCAEVYTKERLGFGRYEFWIVGRVDQIDRNVVLGLFDYPTPEVGPDGTHEIDIEFAQWGDPNAPRGNYTVWPATTEATQQSKSFAFALNGDSSTHSFTWTPTNVLFQSQQGRSDDKNGQFATWLYQPPNPSIGVSQKPMPVHINLWCFKGRPPSNGQRVELIIRAFKFTPM